MDIELNCNADPLDSTPSAFGNLSKDFEIRLKVSDLLYGSDAFLLRVIMNILEKKYKQCKGDPNGMRAYFSNNSAEDKMNIRYIGNRFHVLFQLCESVYFLRSKHADYLESHCSIWDKMCTFDNAEQSGFDLHRLVSGLLAGDHDLVSF